jgi:hypothetical protein
VFLVTANHVLRDAETMGEVGAFVRRTGSDSGVISLSRVYNEKDLDWVRDPANDLAAGLMPLSSDWAIKAIERRLMIGAEDLIPSMSCYTVGCPYGLLGASPKHGHPYVLGGLVSGVAPDVDRVVISAPTFPGNSGGPILVLNPPYRPNGTLVGGPPTILFAGTVLELEVVGGKTPTGESIPPLHVGIGTTIEPILRLLASEKAVEMEKRAE